jgi:hypothetical protein
MVANEPFKNLAELVEGANDCSLVGAIKKHLTSKQLVADTDMKQAVATWLRIPGTDLFCAKLQTLVP